MSSYPILWSFRRCPYAMRARATILNCGIKVEMREIMLKDKPDEFIAASPKATVPVLVLPSGKVIDESQDVMFWALDESGDPHNWLAGYSEDRKLWSAYLDELQGPFKAALDRYKYSTRFADTDDEAAGIKQQNRQKGSDFLEKINNMLADTGFLADSQFGLVDAASLPFVRQFRIADPDWFDAQDWPHLHHWLQSFLVSELFRTIMEKFPVWQRGDEPRIWGGCETKF